jgi:hypothetical protein
MSRQMIRIKQLLSTADTEAVLDRCTNGVLGLNGDDGYPYTVPLSYVYSDGKIYFHSAKKGYKVDCLINDPKVSFTVIDEDMIVSEEFTTYFRSAIITGNARIATGDEYDYGFRALVEKYSGNLTDEVKEKAINECKNAYIIAIDIISMTGKEAIEFVKNRS